MLAFSSLLFSLKTILGRSPVGPGPEKTPALLGMCLFAPGHGALRFLAIALSARLLFRLVVIGDGFEGHEDDQFLELKKRRCLFFL